MHLCFTLTDTICFFICIFWKIFSTLGNHEAAQDYLSGGSTPGDHQTGQIMTILWKLSSERVPTLFCPLWWLLGCWCSLHFQVAGFLFFSVFFSFLFSFLKFIVKLANIQSIQCSLGFGSRFPWFITYTQHPVLIPSAFLNAQYPFSLHPNPLPLSNLSLFFLLKSLLWFSSLTVCNLDLWFSRLPQSWKRR